MNSAHTVYHEIIVIGGGIAGASVAYHLAKLGKTDIALLERHQLTSGTTWHAAGLIMQLRPTHAMTQLVKYNVELYSELETEREKLIYSEDDVFKRIIQVSNSGENNNKLSISSICLITKLPKETVRRKTIELNNKGILKTTKDKGIILGKNYKEIFQDFVPSTVLSVSKLLKKWEKDGVLKYLLSFQIKN